MENYTAECFYNTFKAAIMIGFSDAIIKNKEAVEFGNKYNPKKISANIEKEILDLLNESER